MRFRMVRRWAALCAGPGGRFFGTLREGPVTQGAPAEVKFRIANSWASPALVNGTVQGWLAYADAGTVVGSNIAVVWYQRESDGTWTTWGWTSNSLGAAVGYIHDLYQTPAFIQDGQLVEAAIAAAFEAPKEMMNGLSLGRSARGGRSGGGSTGRTDRDARGCRMGGGADAFKPELHDSLGVSGRNSREPGGEPPEPVDVPHESALFGGSTLAAECRGWPCDGCNRTYSGWGLCRGDRVGVRLQNAHAGRNLFLLLPPTGRADVVRVRALIWPLPDVQRIRHRNRLRVRKQYVHDRQLFTASRLGGEYEWTPGKVSWNNIGAVVEPSTSHSNAAARRGPGQLNIWLPSTSANAVRAPRPAPRATMAAARALRRPRVFAPSPARRGRQ